VTGQGVGVDDVNPVATGAVEERVPEIDPGGEEFGGQEAVE
jgi:hypothetical protein